MACGYVWSFYYYEACPESKDTSRVERLKNCCAYCGNIAVDLDPLPVSQSSFESGGAGFL